MTSEKEIKILTRDSQGIPHESQLDMWLMNIILYPGGEYARIPEGGI
jgi:hypothetical protein